MKTPSPVRLEGRIVDLEPLGYRHVEDLFETSRHEDIWLYQPCPMPRMPSELSAIIRQAKENQKLGHEIPFAIMHLEDKKAIGSTRYLDIQIENESLEIGWTWLGKEYQRTGVNTECKYLLLKHAFETLGASRVQLKTDGRNVQSQQAIERIGAVKEGVLRKQRKMWDGYIRDTVYYSILDTEWPEVKKRIETLMNRT